MLDNLIENFKKISSETKAGENEKRKILIAPSWQKDNILDTCLDSMLDSLLGQGYLIIIRAHPEYKKRYTPRFNAIVEKYKDIPQSELVIETDFSSNVTIFTADLVITDWSGIAHEFSFATLRPTLFINTPMKIINKNYQKINLVPINISLRSKIGVALEMNEMDKVSDTVADLLKRHDEFHASIEKIREATVYNIGTSGEAGGKYIIQRLIEIAEKRNRGA